MKQRLAAWAAEYELSLNEDDPQSSQVNDPEQFEAEGRGLAAQLAVELGEAIMVRYWRDER